MIIWDIKVNIRNRSIALLVCIYCANAALQDEKEVFGVATNTTNQHQRLQQKQQQKVRFPLNKHCILEKPNNFCCTVESFYTYTKTDLSYFFLPHYSVHYKQRGWIDIIRNNVERRASSNLNV